MDDLSGLLNGLVYNIKRRMGSALEGLKDDLCSEDEAVRRPAEDRALEYCEWLYGPPTPAPKEERQKIIEKALLSVGMPAPQARSTAKQGSRATGLLPGAPRTTGPNAIRALMLRLTTDKSYREITLEIKGPCEQNSCGYFCSRCGDVKRPTVAQSGIRERRPRPQCPACKCTIRPPSKREQVCSKCTDALRHSITRLEEFLHREGLAPE